MSKHLLSPALPPTKRVRTATVEGINQEQRYLRSATLSTSTQPSPIYRLGDDAILDTTPVTIVVSPTLISGSLPTKLPTQLPKGVIFALAPSFPEEYIITRSQSGFTGISICGPEDDVQSVVEWMLLCQACAEILPYPELEGQNLWYRYTRLYLIAGQFCMQPLKVEFGNRLLELESKGKMVEGLKDFYANTWRAEYGRKGPYMRTSMQLHVGVAKACIKEEAKGCWSGSWKQICELRELDGMKELDVDIIAAKGGKWSQWYWYSL